MDSVAYMLSGKDLYGNVPSLIFCTLNGTLTPYVEGQGDLVSRLVSPITHIVAVIILIISLLSPHDPPSKPLSSPQSPHG